MAAGADKQPTNSRQGNAKDDAEQSADACLSSQSDQSAHGANSAQGGREDVGVLNSARSALLGLCQLQPGLRTRPNENQTADACGNSLSNSRFTTR